MNKETKDWDLIIQPESKTLSLNLKAVWHYRDLLLLLVRRDFVSVYKQTILGPIWFFVQPIITTITFTIIFGSLAKISTDGVPPILFYLAGITLWTYFADCINKTSNTFVANAGIFGKVYFPRLVMPISVLVSNMIKLGIQFLLFLIVWIYYVNKDAQIQPNYSMFVLIPVLIILMAGLGMGFGILISSITTKYRDVTFLVGFGVQLLMYASPVVYPISMVPEKYKALIMLNPVSSVIESFKYIFIGQGYFSWYYLIYTFFFMILLLLLSILLFNKVEKTFMDTV